MMILSVTYCFQQDIHINTHIFQPCSQDGHLLLLLHEQNVSGRVPDCVSASVIAPVQRFAAYGNIRGPRGYHRTDLFGLRGKVKESLEGST